MKAVEEPILEGILKVLKEESPHCAGIIEWILGKSRAWTPISPPTWTAPYQSVDPRDHVKSGGEYAKRVLASLRTAKRKHGPIKRYAGCPLPLLIQQWRWATSV